MKVSMPFLFIQGMKEDKQQFDETVKKRDPDRAFLYFYHFLCDLFALREKNGLEDVMHITVGNKKNKQKVKDDSLYGALKSIYESVKHKDTLEETLSLSIFISNKTYPHTYPYTYGNPYIRFTKINENFVEDRGGWGNKLLTQNIIVERYKKYLEDKNLSNIMELCINECSSLLNKNEINNN